jgi:exopolyphosphatase/guanosine-5'-triphosphate,3'-diphosphate pyrophosphatase
VVAEINEKTGLQLEVIDGKQEADLIFSNRIDRQFTNRSNFLYIDVGGGSTEVNLFTGSRRFAYGSFNIGGVRILNGAVPPGEQQRMQQWVAENAGQSDLVAIGSGGNIGRLHRLAKLEEDVPLSRKKLSQLLTQLSSLTIEERIRTFKLKPDRADVVVPAGNIYLQIMKWAGIRAIHVPKFGLADGLILQLCRQHERI